MVFTARRGGTPPAGVAGARRGEASGARLSQGGEHLAGIAAGEAMNDQAAVTVRHSKGWSKISASFAVAAHWAATEVACSFWLPARILARCRRRAAASALGRYCARLASRNALFNIAVGWGRSRAIQRPRLAL